MNDTDDSILLIVETSGSLHESAVEGRALDQLDAAIDPGRRGIVIGVEDGAMGNFKQGLFATRPGLGARGTLREMGAEESVSRGSGGGTWLTKLLINSIEGHIALRGRPPSEIYFYSDFDDTPVSQTDDFLNAPKDAPWLMALKDATVRCVVAEGIGIDSGRTWGLNLSKATGCRHEALPAEGMLARAEAMELASLVDAGAPSAPRRHL